MSLRPQTSPPRSLISTRSSRINIPNNRIRRLRLPTSIPSNLTNPPKILTSTPRNLINMRNSLTRSPKLLTKCPRSQTRFPSNQTKPPRYLTSTPSQIIPLIPHIQLIRMLLNTLILNILTTTEDADRSTFKYENTI